jgi:hypothetical protein
MHGWTCIMRCNPWDRAQRDAQTGVRKRGPAGAPNRATGGGGAREQRALALDVTAAGGATVRRAARIESPASRTRAGWRMRS